MKKYKSNVKKDGEFYIFKNQKFFNLFSRLLWKTMYYFKIVICSQKDTEKLINLVESLFNDKFLKKEMIYLSYHEDDRKKVFEEFKKIISS